MINFPPLFFFKVSKNTEKLTKRKNVKKLSHFQNVVKFHQIFYFTSSFFNLLGSCISFSERGHLLSKNIQFLSYDAVTKTVHFLKKTVRADSAEKSKYCALKRLKNITSIYTSSFCRILFYRFFSLPHFFYKHFKIFSLPHFLLQASKVVMFAALFYEKNIKRYKKLKVIKVCIAKLDNGL